LALQGGPKDPSLNGRMPTELPTEPRQRQRAEQQAEVAHGDVVETRNQQQVHHDAAKPKDDDARADAGLERNHKPRDDNKKSRRDGKPEGLPSRRLTLLTSPPETLGLLFI